MHTETSVLDSQDRFIRIPEVCRMTGYSRASLYRLEKQGHFPKRVKLGAGTVTSATAYRLSDIRQWMDSRETAAA